MKYITIMHGAGGSGSRVINRGEYLDGMMFHAAQESYYNRNCPVFLYECDENDQILNNPHNPNHNPNIEYAYGSFFNGSLIEKRGG